MDTIHLLLLLNGWFTIGAIVAGLVQEPEGAVDYLAFLLVWPYALISGCTNAIWKMVIVKLP